MGSLVAEDRHEIHEGNRLTIGCFTFQMKILIAEQQTLVSDVHVGIEMQRYSKHGRSVSGDRMDRLPVREGDSWASFSCKLG